MNPLDASTLIVNDKIVNVTGEVGHVIAVNPTPHVNCLVVAWEMSGIWIYRRDEHFPGVEVYQHALPSEAVPVLPSSALNSLYMMPDPTNWFVQALIGWQSHRAELAKIAEQGITDESDKRVAWYAVKYLFNVVDKMRGAIIDWSQN